MLTLDDFNTRYESLLRKAKELLNRAGQLKDFANIRAVAKDGLSDVDAGALRVIAEMMQDASLQPDTELLKKDIHQLFADLNIEDESPWKYQDPGGLCKQDESYFGDIRLCQQSLRMLSLLSNDGNFSFEDVESQLQSSLDEYSELGYNIQRCFYSTAL